MAERNAGQSRRDVLGTLGVGTAGLVVGGFTTRPGYGQANETIGVGVIGCGGRARGGLMRALKQLPGVRMVAVCDVFDDHLEAGRFVAGGEGVFATRDHHELLARGDVDAVVIATPDHQHVPISVDACKAGKDVYVEKPLVHDIGEAATILEAKRTSGRIVQVGTQQRSMPHIIAARGLVRDGVIGPVHKVRMTWNRNFLPFNKARYNIAAEKVDWKRFLGGAPDQPFDAYRMREWRWMWDFGAGILTDLMVHWLDTANMVLDLPPDDASGMPGTLVTLGRNVATEGAWETPDTINTVWDYPQRKMQLQFDGTFVTANDAAMLELMGENATLYIDRGRYEVRPERLREVKPSAWIIGTGPRGQDFYDRPDGELLHVSNWLECVRSRREPNATVEAGVQAAVAAHLGNRAYREGKVVKFDPTDATQWAISKVEGLAQYRSDSESVWQKAEAGVTLTATGSIRLGPRAVVVLRHSSGVQIAHDRLGQVEIAELTRHWKTNGRDPSLPPASYGRSAYPITPGQELNPMPLDPSEVLQIRG